MFEYHFIFTIKMTLKKILFLLCGIWAFSLGLRFSFELFMTEGWVCIPRNAGYGVNMWFVFIPLCVFGFIVTILSTKEIIKEITKKNEKRV